MSSALRLRIDAAILDAVAEALYQYHVGLRKPGLVWYSSWLWVAFLILSLYWPDLHCYILSL